MTVDQFAYRAGYRAGYRGLPAQPELRHPEIRAQYRQGYTAGVADRKAEKGEGKAEKGEGKAEKGEEGRVRRRKGRVSD